MQRQTGLQAGLYMQSGRQRNPLQRYSLTDLALLDRELDKVGTIISHPTFLHQTNNLQTCQQAHI